MSKSLTAAFTTEKNKSSGATPVSLLEITTDSGILYYSDQSITLPADSSADTPWAGSEADKLYLTSGQFTSTLKDSEDVSGIDTGVNGISWDGTNTPWSGSQADKLYLQSGQFTSTLKDSEDVSAVDTAPQGVSWDGINTPWVGSIADKLYLQSGQFTSTLKTSEDVSGVDADSNGISWDGTNTPWTGDAANKLYLTSGQFTSTLKDSEDVGAIDIIPSDISWDGTNTPWSGVGASKLYLQSGQFTSTLKTSEDVSGVDTGPNGIETNKVQARLDISEFTAGVLQWPNKIKSQIMPGENVVRTGEMSLSLKNNPRIDESIRPGLSVKLYVWFSGLDYFDKVAMFVGTITDNLGHNIYSLDLTALDKGKQFDKQLGSPIDTATYPDVDRDFEGNVQPIVYGDLTNIPCIPIVAGGVSTLDGDYTGGSGTMDLYDASVFPSSANIIVGDETGAYTGKTANQLTGVTGISSNHENGTVVTEDVTSLKYMVAGHAVKAITNPRILLPGVSVDGASPVEVANYTVTIDDTTFGGHIATVTLSNIDTILANVGQVKVTQQQTQNSPAHGHVVSNITTAYYFDTAIDSGYTDFLVQSTVNGAFESNVGVDVGGGSGGSQNDYWRFSRTAILALNGTMVSAVLKCRARTLAGSRTHTLRMIWQSATKATSGITITTSFQTFSTASFSLSAEDWADFQDANTYAELVQTDINATVIYISECWLELVYTPAQPTTAATIAEVLPTVVGGGNSVADKLPLIVDCEGHPDDGSGTYTGVASALIEEPWDVIHHILITYSNGVLPTDIDLSGSFADCASNLPASYKFAFRISQKIWMNQLISRLSEQTFCRFVYEAGIAKLNRIKVSGSSSKSIDTDTDSYLTRGNNRHQVQIRQRGLNEIVNSIEVKTNINYNIGDWGNPDAYISSTDTTDANSISKYGTQQKTWLMFGIGDNSTMASDIRDKLISLYKVSRKEYMFPGWLKNVEVERGDIIELTCSQLGLADRLCEVIEVDYAPAVPTRRRQPQLDFKLLDLNTILESVSVEAEATISVTDTLVPLATPWSGGSASKLYLQSGQFTSTIKDSEDVSAVDISPSSISWDGTNTPWSGGQADKLYLTSGQFTSTIKDSEDVSAVDISPTGISWDGTNTPWSGSDADKLYLQSGQFTSTLKTSEDVSGIDSGVSGISWDGTNTPWTGSSADKLYLQSGQFTSTLKTSISVTAIDSQPNDISWTGTNTPWCGNGDDKLYLTSGQFTSTIKDSEDVSGIDLSAQGICTNSINQRLGL